MDMFNYIFFFLKRIGLLPLTRDRVLVIFLLLLMICLYQYLSLLLLPGNKIIDVNPLAILRKKIEVAESNLQGICQREVMFMYIFMSK